MGARASPMENGSAPAMFITPQILGDAGTVRQHVRHEREVHGHVDAETQTTCSSSCRLLLAGSGRRDFVRSRTRANWDTEAAAAPASLDADPVLVRRPSGEAISDDRHLSCPAGTEKASIRGADGGIEGDGRAELWEHE